MLFNSFQFVLFLPIAVLFYYVLPKRLKSFWLLATSYFFYGCWNASYIALIALSTLVTYLCALLVEKAESMKNAAARKKLFVALSLVINLSILFVFKYYNFFALSVGRVFPGVAFPTLNLLLPVGISFYTFQALGYTIDVYRGEIPAERNIITYALFVSFFPQLVAGPIESAKSLIPQLKTHNKFDAEKVKRGLVTMLWGYFLKLVIADRAAISVNAVYNADVSATSGMPLAVATVLFALQIYCDFSGYSLIALGAARTMGFELMRNFEQPYLCASIGEFWRRWHISLSSWFRNYLYIPLGGNRCSSARRNLNLAIVFIVSGLWHGANWTFVMWGALHGLYQIAGRLTKTARDRLYGKLKIKTDSPFIKILRVVFTFSLVCFAWISFAPKAFPMLLLR